MVDFLQGKKSNFNSQLDEAKPWEKKHDWSNPFASGDEGTERESTKEERKRRRKKKNKRSSRHHKMTEEEHTEISSMADTMLDDILGDENEAFAGGPLAKVREGSFENDSSRRHRGCNPFDDTQEEVEPRNGDEINKAEFEALMRGENPNPYVVAEEEECEFVPKEKEVRQNTNPFEDDTVASSKAMDSSPEAQIMSEESSTDQNGNFGDETKSYASQPEEEEEDDEEAKENNDDKEEEDLVESSKRLLRMADKRLQYQQHNDEVKQLRETIDSMNAQAEAMSEQLRRAVETKCDLVLAQTEMERCHEQDLIVKDEEIREIKLYTQELIDYMAKNELNFMNEISLLSKRVEDLTDKNKQDLSEKDAHIAQLEERIAAMRLEKEQPHSNGGGGGMSEFFFPQSLKDQMGSPEAPITCE